MPTMAELNTVPPPPFTPSSGKPLAAGFPWDSSDPFFSAPTRDILINIFRCYIHQAIIFVGIPANFVCCLVFLKQGLSSRINLLLFSLAVADFINVFTLLLARPNCYFADKIQSSNWDVSIDTKITYITIWSSFVSGTLIVIMSVDRCLCVVIPIKAAKLLTYRPMLAAVVLTYVVELACYLPLFMAFSVQWRTDPATNGSLAYRAVTGWFRADSRLVLEVPSYLNLIAMPVFLTVVVVCCTITITHLRRASLHRQKMRGKEAEEGAGSEASKITRMLLLLCIAYVICLVPRVVCDVTYNLVPGFFLYKKYHNTFVIFWNAFIAVSSCLNSTLNFFAYLALSTKFRATLKQLFSCVSVCKTGWRQENKTAVIIT